VEGAETKAKARSSSALDRISERITLAFQALSRLEAIQGPPIEKKRLCRLLTEFNTFAQQVGDALPILEQMGNEATTFKVLAMGAIISASTSPTE
jgi:hypothetical protein